MEKGSCHCGAVTVVLKEIPASYTECNCSICRRYAAQWMYTTADQVEIIAAENVITRYQWGDHEIDFCHCRECGSITHYESLPKNPASRVAVNARVLNPSVLKGLGKREFDGAAM